MSGLVCGIPSGCKQCLLDWLQPVATSFSTSSVLKVAIYAKVAVQLCSVKTLNSVLKIQ